MGGGWASVARAASTIKPARVPPEPVWPTQMTTNVIESRPQVPTKRLSMKTFSARPDPSVYIPPPGLGYSRIQKLFAEFFGTFALVLFSCGAICADQFLRNTNENRPRSPGHLPRLTGSTFGAMVTAVEPRVSGGHHQSRRHHRLLGHAPPGHLRHAPLLGRATRRSDSRRLPLALRCPRRHLARRRPGHA